MAELRSLRVVSGRQVQSSSGPPGSSAPQTPTVISPPPPPTPRYSRSGVDTVAAVFRVDGAQTGTDAGNAAQLEPALLGEKKAAAVNSGGLWRVYGAAIGFSKQIKAKGA